MAWSIFDIDGNNPQSLYDINGSELSSVYDIDGTEYTNNEDLAIYNVMTFNPQNWTQYNSDSTIVNAMFDLYNPVVVGLQECTETGGYVPDVFQNYYPATDGSHLMMFSNTPITNVVVTPYEDNRGQYRAYQKGTITLDGKTITVINTHVEYSPSETRVAQLQELLEELDNHDSFICFGDFNLSLHASAGEQYTYFVKPLLDAGYHSANWTERSGYVDTWFSGNTIEGSARKEPCDSIITSSDIRILNTYFDKSKIVSGTSYEVDHLPVIATIGFVPTLSNS